MCMMLSRMVTHISVVLVTELSKCGNSLVSLMGSFSTGRRLPLPTYTSLYILKSAFVKETA